MKKIISNYSIQHIDEIKFSTTDIGTIYIGDKKHSFLNQYCRIKASPKSFTGKERNIEVEEFKRMSSKNKFSVILRFEGTKSIDDIRWIYKKVDDRILASFIVGTDDIRAIFKSSVNDFSLGVESGHGLTFKLKESQKGERLFFVYVGQHLGIKELRNVKLSSK